MDTSNSTGLNFVVTDLAFSEFEEDRALAIRAGQTVMALVDSLKPILKHITSPRSFLSDSDSSNGIYSDSTYKVARVIGHEPDLTEKPGRIALFIDHDGKFILVRISGRKTRLGFPHWEMIRVDSDGVWPRFPLGDLIAGLQRLLAEAEKKREDNLRTIAVHRQKLDEILAILKK